MYPYLKQLLKFKSHFNLSYYWALGHDKGLSIGSCKCIYFLMTLTVIKRHHQFFLFSLYVQRLSGWSRKWDCHLKSHFSLTLSKPIGNSNHRVTGFYKKWKNHISRLLSVILQVWNAISIQLKLIYVACMRAGKMDFYSG